MTEEEIQAIEARANAATEGPWEVRALAGYPNECWAGPAIDAPGYSDFYTGYEGEISRPNAEFIAHARTDVPALVAEIRRLRSVNSAGHSCTMLAEQLATAQEEVRKLRRELAKSEEISWDFSVGFGCRGDD